VPYEELHRTPWAEVLPVKAGRPLGCQERSAQLGDLYRRGLEGRQLSLILTDGCAGLGAAIRTVYPRVRHQRCWVHKMRNIVDSQGESQADWKASTITIIHGASKSRA
jgi:transposase-like protein